MKKDIELQYKGFIKTPNLWNNSHVLELKQFQHQDVTFPIKNPSRFKEIRLGKRVEQFFNFQIVNTSKHTVLTSNLQIKDGKQTIGEIDTIIKKNEKPIHIEIVYKFYLYNPNINTGNELDKWVGPNQKDSLIYKLSKLTKKQLPLLHSAHCKSGLENLNLIEDNITQNVCFKAQLYLPFTSTIKSIKPLNKNCVYGFYLSFFEINKLENFEFYIPEKLDWLIEPNHDVNWLTYTTAQILIKEFIDDERSPMVWLKDKKGELQKCFITFW